MWRVMSRQIRWIQVQQADQMERWTGGRSDRGRTPGRSDRREDSRQIRWGCNQQADQMERRTVHTTGRLDGGGGAGGSSESGQHAFQIEGRTAGWRLLGGRMHVGNNNQTVQTYQSTMKIGHQ
jgi:hypothetical protein